MSVFLSRTSQPPYDIVDGHPLNADTQNIVIAGTSGREIATVRSTLYLIVEDAAWNTVEIRVENETLTGVSLFISKTNILGEPEGWTKKITLNNVNGILDTYIQGIMLEWRIINNIYFVSIDQVNVNINVYGS